MARVFSLICLGLLPACAGDASRGDEKTPSENPSSEARERAACRSALRTLSEGRYAAFRGFHACIPEDADAALGPAENAPGSLHPWGKARRHRGGPATPAGLTIVVQNERIVAIEFFRPVLDQPLRGSLGEPETKIVSGLGSDWEQWVYAARGLSAHVDNRGAVMAVYAYEPMSTADFLRSSIAKVYTTEYPLER